MPDKKISRINHIRTADGYQLDLRLGRQRQCAISLRYGVPKIPFACLVMRVSPQGMGLGLSLFLLNISLGFYDARGPSEPKFNYGFLLYKGLTLYLPQRYAIFK